MLPFLPYDTVASNYQFFSSCNVNGVMEQGSYSSKQAGWQELKNYVSAKLMWNCNLNTNKLIENFMANYYKDASPYMSQYFNEYRMKMLLNDKERKISPSIGGVYGNFSQPHECFSLREIKEWEGLIEKAIESIQSYKEFNYAMYTKLYNRIIKEKVFFLNLLNFIFSKM